jgi:hypothetical protein
MNDKYKIFLDKVFKDTPDFLKINDNFLILDMFVLFLDKKAHPWLFKVYLEKNHNILNDDKFTEEFKNKYPNSKIINQDGNLFLNYDALYFILLELKNLNQIKYDVDTFKLV